LRDRDWSVFVRRNRSGSRTATSGKAGTFLAALVFAAGGLLASPTVPSKQDLSVILTGADTGSGNWNAYIEKSAAGSIDQGKLAFAPDPMVTGAIGGGGIKVRGIGTISVKGSRYHPDAGPDETRVNRAEKSARIVRVVPAAPPKAFSAGSVLSRTSFLLAPAREPALAMVFAKPKIMGEEIRIATAFHETPKKAEPLDGMAPMVARLVNNDKLDVLATAYAPAKPDYARTSPFEALLKPQRQPKDTGRFIPPIGRKDHEWAANPLPASAFSPQQQDCLARGIYFEARGESVKGQAAVAEVILNRVRNPAYPQYICDVVYQNENWRNRCQFSFACDGIRDRVIRGYHWEIAREVAKAVTAGAIWFPELASATHYHAVYVRPDWAKTMKRVERIGRHVFYKTYGGGWS
jgi:spore germination cell wall hydrolase CwlJ-like protein